MKFGAPLQDLRPCTHESGSVRLRSQTGTYRPTVQTGSNYRRQFGSAIRTNEVRIKRTEPCRSDPFGSRVNPRVGGRGGCDAALGVSLGETASSADLGGSQQSKKRCR